MYDTTKKGRRSMRRLHSAASAWRHLVNLHADAYRRTSAAEREHYSAVHHRIMNVCDDLARGEGRAESRTRMADRFNRRHATIDDRALEANKDLTFDAANKEGRDEMIRQLRALLRPWANPKAIHAAPKAIVEDLLAKERALEERITGASSRSLRGWLQPIFFVVVVGVTAGLFLTLLVSLSGTTSYWLENLSYSLVSRAHQVIIGDQMLVTAVLAWVAGTVILWSAFRR